MRRAAVWLLPVLAVVPLRSEACTGQDLAVAERNRVAALEATRRSQPVRRDYPECPPLGAEIVEWRDAQGVLRRAMLRSGSDDSAFTAETYFDAEGRPRFAYVRGGAVSGARLTQRIAIDADGRRACEARRVTAPGYTFPNPWPDALLPLTAAREGRCPQPDESARP